MINSKFLKYIFSGIVIIELLSFLVFLNDLSRPYVFIFICLLYLILSLKDLKYAVYISLIELILGSKGGYLFYIEIADSVLSLRIAFWTILLSVYCTKILFKAIRQKKLSILLPKTTWLKYLGIFCILLAWGLINGLFLKNDLSSLFFDFNGYLYLLLIFPVFSLLSRHVKDSLSDLSTVFLGSVLWISVKTVVLLYLFSHEMPFLNSQVYSWIRNTSVGEITKMSDGLYRIFFQSHIFVIFFVIALILVLYQKINFKKKFISFKILAIYFSAVISSMVLIISMSRSNWIGIALSIVLLYAYFIWQGRLKAFFKFSSILFSIILLSYLSILLVINIPFPKTSGTFSTTQVLSERASNFKSEAGVSSRWNLLPELNLAIGESIFLGKGFGSTVSYISNDPRVRENNPDGVYTTFAFEWGWLDTWLKLGLLGALSYLTLFFIVTKDSFYFMIKSSEDYRWQYFFIITVLLSLSAINFFSPYLNHPLGIGAFIYALLYLELLKKLNKQQSLAK